MFQIAVNHLKKFVSLSSCIRVNCTWDLVGFNGIHLLLKIRSKGNGGAKTDYEITIRSTEVENLGLHAFSYEQHFSRQH